MRAAIFANGVIENAERARDAAENADLVLAANGGAIHCLHLGVIPAVVIGDLDSLDEGNRQAFEAGDTEFITHPQDKDQIDLELSLLTAAARDASEIIVLGAMGGRLDMTVANVHLLALPELNGVQVELWHGDQTATLVQPPGGRIMGRTGDGISLIPVGGDVQGITTEDLKFDLKDETLSFGPARGVSNIISGPNPRVALGTGSLLIVHTPGPLSNA